MTEYLFPKSSEAITLFRQWQKENKNKEDNIDRRAQTKLLTQARNQFANDFIQETLLKAVNDNTGTEPLVWFWFNHFNVFWRKGLVAISIADYVDNVIRPNIKGRFRDLLMATLTHPAMLAYLDNVQNNAERINENYARELLELHTLGVDGGYTQNDVRETARVLTGVGLRPLNEIKMPDKLLPLVREKGQFFFNPKRHEKGVKHVLGHDIAGQGFDEVETLVDILCQHPATAKRIATKLAVFLLGDNPSSDVIQQASKTFTETKGDLAKTTDIILQAVPNNKERSFKDPYRYIISSVRLLSTGVPVINSRPLTRWLAGLGEPLFACLTPNGYSLYGHDWISSGQLAQRFEIAKEIVSTVPHLTEQMVLSKEVLARESTQQLINSLSAQTRDVLDKTNDVQEKLALLLVSPEFMYW